MTRWQIRDAELADLDDLVAIEQQATGRWGRGVFRAEFTTSISSLWLLETNVKKPVGFLVAWQVADEMQLHNMAVTPAYRRCGAGRYLLNFLVQEACARHLQRIVLDVRGTNHAAQQLYLGLNFRSVGVRRGYYADTGENAILMERELCLV